MRGKGTQVASSAAWAARLAVLVILLFPLFAARAQEPAPAQQQPRHVGAFWAGYMSNWGIRPPWSIWFDTHYNTRAFFVLRGGLTYRF
ncbi:MAG: hypothetical protein KJN97_18365, partial [Deltaproteobacteria bacterium]|nr:hypothetical protein [Deltaproteobacteria bacterium]